MCPVVRELICCTTIRQMVVPLVEEISHICIHRCYLTRTKCVQFEIVGISKFRHIKRYTTAKHDGLSQITVKFLIAKLTNDRQKIF